MPIRARWSDDYWNKLDKETAKKMRSTCPRCGSSETYYNKHYKTRHCGRCEHTFAVRGVDDRPWWKRIFGH